LILVSDLGDPPPREGLGTILKVGLVGSLLGIAAGAVVALATVEELGDLCVVRGFTWLALAPILLGVVGVASAAVDVVRRERYRPAAKVFVLGLAAIASPFLFALLVGALLVLLLISALTGLS
jgi:hypothetical protein